MDFDRAADIAWRVFDVAPSIPGRRTDPKLIFLRNFPNGSCDSMAYATAGVLFERGLGDWWVVTQGDGESSHVWLEWRTGEGDPDFSIDATAHQFPGISEPFIGPGPTPSSVRFKEPESAHLFSRLPAHWPRDAELALLEHVKRNLT